MSRQQLHSATPHSPRPHRMIEPMQHNAHITAAKTSASIHSQAPNKVKKNVRKCPLRSFFDASSPSSPWANDKKCHISVAVVVGNRTNAGHAITRVTQSKSGHDRNKLSKQIELSGRRSSANPLRAGTSRQGRAPKRCIRYCFSRDCRQTSSSAEIIQIVTQRNSASPEVGPSDGTSEAGSRRPMEVK